MTFNNLQLVATGGLVVTTLSLVRIIPWHFALGLMFLLAIAYILSASPQVGRKLLSAIVILILTAYISRHLPVSPTIRLVIGSAVGTLAISLLLLISSHQARQSHH